MTPGQKRRLRVWHAGDGMEGRAGKRKRRQRVYGGGTDAEEALGETYPTPNAQ